MEFDEIESPIALLGNAENSSLEEKLAFKRKYLKKLEEFCTEQDKQILNLEEHERNLLQNIDYYNEVKRATESEISSEVNLIRIRVNEKNYLDKQAKNMKLDIEEIESNHSSLERWLFNQKRKLDDLQEVVVWETDSWQEWLQRTYTNEKTNLAITTMLGQDSNLIKELVLKLEKANLEVARWKKLKENAVNDQLVAQMELKRNTEEFSNAHEQRQNILRLWDESIEEMEQREARMICLGKALKITEDRVATLDKVVNNKNAQLAEELSNKNNLERQLELLNAALEDLKNHLSQYGPDSEIEKELEALQNKVKTLSVDERNLRSAIFKTREAVMNRNQNLTDLKNTFRNMENDYASVGEKATSIELRLTLAKSMMAQEEKFLAKLDKDLLRLRESFSSAERNAKQLEETRQFLRNNLQVAGVTGRELFANLVKINSKKDNLANTLQELTWKERNLEERWSIMKGSAQRSSMEMDQRLSNELKVTRETRDEKFRHSQTLNSSLNKTVGEIKKYTAELDEAKLQNKSLEMEAFNLDKAIEFAQASFQRETNRKQEMMVESCLLQVSTRRLQISVEQITDFISNSELEILEIQNVIQEKLSFADEFRKAFRLQKNKLSDEKQNSSVVMQKCITKLNAVSSRYDLYCKSNNDNVSDPEKIVKIAEKEKQQLEMKDRDIEDSIGKTDREIQALRNSLDLLEKANTALRNKTKEQSHEDRTEVPQLESKLRSLFNELYSKQQYLNQIQKNIRDLSQHLQNTRTNSNAELELKELLAKVDYLSQHLEEQEMKLSRADNQVKLLLDKQSVSTQDEIILKLLAELKKKVDENVADILSTNPEADVYFSREINSNKTLNNRTYTKQ